MQTTSQIKDNKKIQSWQSHHVFTAENTEFYLNTKNLHKLFKYCFSSHSLFSSALYMTSNKSL